MLSQLSLGLLQLLLSQIKMSQLVLLSQDLVVDNTPLSDWKEEPSVVIRLYFVFRKEFEKIVNKGLVDLDGNKEGYLKGLPVG